MFNNDWDIVLKDEVDKIYFIELMKKVYNMYNKETIFPNVNEIFRAMQLTSYQETKVVILGQDPYHGKGQANGLAFSVNKTVKIPPSLRNIYKELHAEYGKMMPNHGDLSGWAKQGVLLLNSTLTVQSECANSHKDFGWDLFTNSIIKELNNKKEPIVFVLWGNFAIKKKMLINNEQHLVLCSPHPSPLSASRGFLGNNHFIQINQFLTKNNRLSIDWFDI